jgi:serine/threonine protein kinase
MSPEQLAGDALDGRSDIYALGLVTFNMLTGKLPFPSDSAQESMIMRLTDKPKSLAEMRPDVNWPPEVQAVMDKALERDATLRYQNATEFGRDLVRAIERMDAKPAPAPQMTESRNSAPATLVAPPTMPTPRSSPTVSVPAPGPAGQGSNGLPALPPSPPRRKILLPAIGSIVALLVISAALYNPIMNRNRGLAAADTSSHASGLPQSPQSPPKTDSTPRKDTTQQRSASPDECSKSVPASPTTTIDVKKELSLAETEAKGDDTVSANKALARIAKIGGLLNVAGDIARAGLVKYSAYLTLDDTPRACAALKDVKDRARGTSSQKRVDGYLEACP